MKFINLLFIYLVFLVSNCVAQWSWLCPQRAFPAQCFGERNVGTSCVIRRPRSMWYYNQANRTCLEMAYLGCGGTNNRWCSRISCERRCVRIQG